MALMIHEGRMFHVGKGRPYHEENDPRGIAEAAREQYDSIDLDTWPSAPCPPGTGCGDPKCIGHEMNTHWRFPMLQDGFHDPLGLLNPHTPIDQMTRAEGMRLRTRDGYRIEPLTRQLRRCARVGLVASIEPKGRRRWSVFRLRRLRNAARRVRCKAIVKSPWTAVVRAGKAAGFQVRYTKDHRPGM